jgi:hypothetical protein
MRMAIVALLALVAVAAAGLWGLAQFGAPKPMVAEEHAPVARVETVSSAGSTTPLAPPQLDPGAAHPNAASDLKTEKPKADAAGAKTDTQVAAATPAPSPAVTPAPAPPPSGAVAPDATTATPATTAETAAEARPTDPLKAAAKKVLEQKLKQAGIGATTPTTPPAPTLAPGFAPAPSAASAPPPPPAATAAPAPAATPAPAPAATPPAADNVQIASAPAPVTASAAAPAASASASLADQFKTRKVAYNRPPATLYLDRPIDISLVIDATAAADPAAQLQGFPGDVVKRDVDLSDTVSAQLTGVGFDIVTQTVGRQTLSSKLPNRWQWRVTPTEPGAHTLMLDIFGYKTNSLDAEPLDAYRDKITVQVQQLDRVIKWAKGIQPIFAVIAAIAGLLSALVAVLRFRKDGKKSG